VFSFQSDSYFILIRDAIGFGKPCYLLRATLFILCPAHTNVLNGLVRREIPFFPVCLLRFWCSKHMSQKLAKKNLRAGTISIFVNCTYQFSITSEIMVSRNKQKIDRTEGNIYLSRELNFTLFWIFVMVFHF